MTNADFRLTGQTALITGAGRGIGLGTARRLAAAGADVIIADYIAENAHSAAAEIENMGRKSLSIEVDVRDSGSVNQMAELALQHFDNIDILVCNAGIAQAIAAEECSDEEWLNMMAVNLNGVFYCCRAIGRHMLERGSGSIVNTAFHVGHDIQYAAAAIPLQRGQGGRHHADEVAGRRMGGPRRPRQLRFAGLHRHGYDRRGHG